MFLKSSLGDKYVNSWLGITKTPAPRRLKQEKNKFKVYTGEQSQSKVSLANRKFLFQNLRRVKGYGTMVEYLPSKHEALTLILVL